MHSGIRHNNWRACGAKTLDVEIVIGGAPACARQSSLNRKRIRGISQRALKRNGGRRLKPHRAGPAKPPTRYHVIEIISDKFADVMSTAASIEHWPGGEIARRPFALRHHQRARRRLA